MEYVFLIYAKVKMSGDLKGKIKPNEPAATVTMTIKTRFQGIGYFILAGKFLITGMRKLMHI